ncbi:MAG: aldo/keto reductase [Elusimicrobiota bacterium]|jgi:aryl-alcohol dehydrogenase-like predicted oxidoreductase|nr:aldo/keto reductase [Elusimicrobiota bacterium]
MKTVLGRTGIEVNKNGFGALPIQRRTIEDAEPILKAAFDAGINFFDTARAYTDSEEKIGRALSAVRTKFFLATKTAAKNGEELKKDLDTSLKLLKTDYIDIYQFHNPAKYPRPDDGSGLYEAALEAKKTGKIKFIGITNHRIAVALEAVNSGLFDTMQFPFNYLSDEKEIGLTKLCAQKNVGFIAMKALSGGLLNDIDTGAAYMNTLKNVVPIWGIQTMDELKKMLNAAKNENAPTAQQQKRIDQDRKELTGEFCRCCNYCAPCPKDIKIFNCARMSLLLRRMPPAQWLTKEWQEDMLKIKDCINCGACKSRCPYGLDIPNLLKRNLEDYMTFLK